MIIPIQLISAQLSSNQTPNKINLFISNVTLGQSPTGLTLINGIILNNSTENVKDVKIDVILYDTENKSIQQTSRFVTAPFSAFEPGSTESFRFLMMVNDFDHYNATSYGEKLG